MIKLSLIVLFSAISIPVFAGEWAQPALETQTPAFSAPSDLTLSNFFTEGWDQPWGKRVTPGGAPDMALLHVQTSFLEREFRFDFYSQQNTAGAKARDLQFMDGLVAYSFNRRIMLELYSSYEWMNNRTGPDTSGAAEAAVARVQLVDVPGASYDFNFRVTSPNQGIDVKQTTLSPALAGWNDLTGLGLKKVGLYYSILEDTYVGPAKPGSKHTDIGYAVSLAKTWTDPDTLVFGNFTTFVECYATTNLDGDERDDTDVDITPGVRFNFYKGNILMAGVDLPLSYPHNFDTTYRLTCIVNF